MKLLEWPARIRQFLDTKLWEIEPEERSRLSAIRLLQFTIMLVEGFVRDHLLLRASALTYFTVLSMVPLLAVVVAIASAVGIGSQTFVEWFVQTISAGAPGAGEEIRTLIQGVDFSGFGKVGAGVLFVMTVLAISNVESALNDIWGVTKGRAFMRRFADYLAVMVVAPLLGGLALSIVATFQSQWGLSRLHEIPVFQHLGAMGSVVLPVFVLVGAFTFLYWFLPNTGVPILSALIGGAFSGVVVAVAQWFYVQFSVGVARADVLFGGFALIPLLFAWIYVFWAIVLLGAEIAFAHQNFAHYRKEVREAPAGPAEREAIALRIALEVARCFGAGVSAPTASGLADELGVPVRTVRNVALPLEEAGILSKRADPQEEEAYQLARPAETIEVTDVLDALRGRREPVHGDRATGVVAAKVLTELESAAREASGGRTLADLLPEVGEPRGIDPPEARP